MQRTRACDLKSPVGRVWMNWIEFHSSALTQFIILREICFISRKTVAIQTLKFLFKHLLQFKNKNLSEQNGKLRRSSKCALKNNNIFSQSYLNDDLVIQIIIWNSHFCDEDQTFFFEEEKNFKRKKIFFD